MDLKIFPERVFGNLLIAATVLNDATGPIFSLTSRTTSFSISSEGLLTPEFIHISPTGTSPFNSSGISTVVALNHCLYTEMDTVNDPDDHTYGVITESNSVVIGSIFRPG